MGAALRIAAAKNAYVLTDRASWLNFQAKGGLKLLLSGDEALFNQYAYLPINPERQPSIKAGAAMDLEAWLVGENAAILINGYRIPGKRLFTHNAE